MKAALAKLCASPRSTEAEVAAAYLSATGGPLRQNPRHVAKASVTLAVKGSLEPAACQHMSQVAYLEKIWLWGGLQESKRPPGPDLSPDLYRRLSSGNVTPEEFERCRSYQEAVMPDPVDAASLLVFDLHTKEWEERRILGSSGPGARHGHAAAVVGSMMFARRLTNSRTCEISATRCSPTF